MCRGGEPPLVLAAFDVLQDSAKPPLVRNNLRLLFGRWLAQHALYDEALDQSNALQPDQVIDPAALLFYQGVCHHRLLQKDPCLTALSRLMENKGKIPQTVRTAGRIDGSGPETAEDGFAGRSLPIDG